MAENHHADSFAPPVRYRVWFPAPQTHYAEVEARLPAQGADSVEVMMPVWTPGSYLVREFARNVEFETPVTATRKNRWLVAAGGAAEVVVRYRVYCREMSVRTNWVEDEFAFLNGAPTFLTLADGVPRAHEVHLELPAQWKTSVSGLDEVAPHFFSAPNYDTLVDSPILAGC